MKGVGRVFRDIRISSCVELFYGEKVAAEGLLAVGSIVEAGEATQVAFQVAEEAFGEIRGAEPMAPTRRRPGDHFISGEFSPEYSS